MEHLRSPKRRTLARSGSERRFSHTGRGSATLSFVDRAKTPRFQLAMRWGAIATMVVALVYVLLPGRVRLEQIGLFGSDEPATAEETRAESSRWATSAHATVQGADAPARASSAEPAGSSEVATSVTDLGHDYDCLIEPNQIVDIGSPVRGRIADVYVARSDLVEAGQVLVEIDSQVERAQVEYARERAEQDVELRARAASLDLGERKVDRARRLYDENALALDLRDDIETETRLARLELEKARVDQRLARLELQTALEVLDRRTIRSPLSGVVLDRYMWPGEVVEDQNVLTIAQVDPLRVEVVLPASRFGSVEVGERASITPETPLDTVHVGEVTVVDRVIDPASGTFRVLIELPNPELTIPSGLHCRVRFLPPSSE